jgi:hypothetical protein
MTPVIGITIALCLGSFVFTVICAFTTPRPGLPV